MINLKKLLTNILTTLNAKVNRSGDVMSGDVTVAIPDGSSAASVGARCGTAANPTSWAVLQASTAGNAGVYDNKHNKWVARTDNNGYHHIPLTLSPINSSKIACSSIGTSFRYASIAGMAAWHVIAVHFTVNEVSDVLLCFRGERFERYLIDAPSAGRFRGGIFVDWSNNRIGIRCINAPSGKQNLVYFDYVYGVL